MKIRTLRITPTHRVMIPFQSEGVVNKTLGLCIIENE